MKLTKSQKGYTAAISLAPLTLVVPQIHDFFGIGALGMVLIFVIALALILKK